MQFAAFVTGLVAFFSGAATAQLLPTPSLVHLYSFNCSLDPTIDIGDGPYGKRVAIPITGGRVEGPRISGNIRNLGADWGLTDNHGVFHPDTRYGLTTDDGAEIYIRTFGSAQSDGPLLLHGLYETGSDKYWWMNDVVAVGVLQGGDGWVYIDMYYLQS